MRESTLVRNHSAAPNVITNARHQVIWNSTLELTQVINHSLAPSVATNAQDQTNWRIMKGSTMMRNHSAAPSVNINAQHQVIWRNIKEFMISHSKTLKTSKNIDFSLKLKELTSNRKLCLKNTSQKKTLIWGESCNFVLTVIKGPSPCMILLVSGPGVVPIWKFEWLRN